MLKSPGSYRIRGITFLFWATDSFGEGGCLWGKTDRRDSSQAEMADLQSTLGRSLMAIPHNSKCRYGERGAADAKPKAQIILDAAKVSAASGGCSEPKQGQRSQSARSFCPRSTMRVPQPDIIEHFGNADAVPQPPKRCLSRKAGIVRCCLCIFLSFTPYRAAHRRVPAPPSPRGSTPAATQCPAARWQMHRQ